MVSDGARRASVATQAVNEREDSQQKRKQSTGHSTAWLGILVASISSNNLPIRDGYIHTQIAP